MSHGMVAKCSWSSLPLNSARHCSTWRHWAAKTAKSRPSMNKSFGRARSQRPFHRSSPNRRCQATVNAAKSRQSTTPSRLMSAGSLLFVQDADGLQVEAAGAPRRPHVVDRMIRRVVGPLGPGAGSDARRRHHRRSLPLPGHIHDPHVSNVVEIDRAGDDIGVVGEVFQVEGRSGADAVGVGMLARQVVDVARSRSCRTRPTGPGVKDTQGNRAKSRPFVETST